jgi:hypothetical protein
MAKLDRVTDAAPALQRAHEAFEFRQVPMQIVRQLPKNQGQLFAQTRCAAALQRDGRQGLDELFVVRQIAVGFDCESEIGRSPGAA